MTFRSPFRHFDPHFCSGLFEDPLLLLATSNPCGNILVDCGQLTHLTKRLLKSIRTVLVSHAHMDHFIGFDAFARAILVTNKTINLIGPPGIAEKSEMRMQAYNWNLTEAYYCNFNIVEVSDDTLRTFYLDGQRGFTLFFKDEQQRDDRIVYEDPYLFIEADICDHKIPVLLFKITEKPGFQIDENKLAAAGIQRGPWINALKEWFQGLKSQKTLQKELLQHGQNNPFFLQDPLALYDSIKQLTPQSSVGYITDIGFTNANIKTVERLMQDVTFLVCECTYLRENRQKARESYHLCTDDLNQIIDQLKPSYCMPMHLSKTYLPEPEALYRELPGRPSCSIIQLPDRMTQPPFRPGPIDFKDPASLRRYNLEKEALSHLENAHTRIVQVGKTSV